ncbi:MAG TPA: hypothetical protein VN113_12390 [Caulobacter sp.]|nr:hypothetical protein [Caulobacter sp.]
MRHLYLAFLLAFAVVLFGFFPSFAGAMGPLDPLRMIHGGLATAWMAMLVIQAWLIGHGHARWHRWIGRSSLVIAPALVISAFAVVADMLGPKSHFDVPLRLTLAWIDLWSLALFATVYVLAILKRGTMFLHMRFMASTVFVALPPALGRAYGMNIPSIGGLAGALPPTYWTIEAVLVGLVLWDGIRGRWLTPWLLTLAVTLAIHLTMFQAPAWPAYVAFARLIGLPSA